MKKANVTKAKTNNEAAVIAAQQKLALESLKRYVLHLNKKKN
jgi:hypothetical protein